MKIYFAGAIKGGREKVEDYAKMVKELETYGEVLTKHVADPNLIMHEEGITAKEIYTRDEKWLNECDVVLADITVPSLGVGYELAYAESKHKPIICVYEKNKVISAMITGNEYFIQIPYTSMEELIKEIHKVMKELKEE